MINKNVMYNFFINLNDLLKNSIFIKNHSKRHIQSKKTLKFSRAHYARAFRRLLNDTQYTRPKHGGTQYTRGVSPSWKCIVVHVHVLSLSGLGFQIKYIVTKVRKTTTLYILPCFVHSMYLLVKVTCWNNGILNK